METESVFSRATMLKPESSHHSTTAARSASSFFSPFFFLLSTAIDRHLSHELPFPIPAAMNAWPSRPFLPFSFPLQAFSSSLCLAQVTLHVPTCLSYTYIYIYTHTRTRTHPILYPGNLKHLLRTFLYRWRSQPALHWAARLRGMSSGKQGWPE